MGVITIMREGGEKEGGDMIDIMKEEEITMKGEEENILREEEVALMRDLQCKCIGEEDLWL